MLVRESGRAAGRRTARVLGREHRAEGETRRRRRRRRPWLRARGPLAGGKGERGSRPSIAARGGPRAQATRRRPRGSQHRRVGTRCVGRACCLFPDVSNSRPEKREHEQGNKRPRRITSTTARWTRLPISKSNVVAVTVRANTLFSKTTPFAYHMAQARCSASQNSSNPALQQLNGSFRNKTRHGCNVNFLHASASHHAVGMQQIRNP